MEDALTEAPPPSRFFNEDLNNFTPPSSPPLPSPFLVFSSDPNQTYPLRPSLLIIAISSPSLHLLHHVSSKTLIGTLILPEISFSGNSIIDPSSKDEDNKSSCNIYSIDDGRSVLLVLVQCSISAERSHAVAKLLIDGDRISPERVLIFDSVESRNFRGKLPPDETFGFKLETTRSVVGSMVKGLDYFPSGSMIDGFGAALLARCQIRRIQGTLCVSWPPQNGSSVVSLLKSILLSDDLLPKIRLNADVLEFDRFKDSRFDSELYT